MNKVLTRTVTSLEQTLKELGAQAEKTKEQAETIALLEIRIYELETVKVILAKKIVSIESEKVALTQVFESTKKELLEGYERKRSLLKAHPTNLLRI